MKCPSCSEALSARAERCSSCGAVVAPLTEGALAPNPREVTPPPPVKVEPLRAIPGLPKKERTWRDEVQERVRSRRSKRAQSSLPLFEQPEVAGSAEPASPAATEPSAPAETQTARVVERPAAPTPGEEPPAPSMARPAEVEGPVAAERDFESTRLSDEELADLPLRTPEPTSVVATGHEDREIPGVSVELRAEAPGLDEELIPANEDDDQAVSLNPPPGEPAPLERPARVSERAQAAAVDAGILVVLGALVIYFAGRAARVDVASLIASWPWLMCYLALLGIFYAGYFTGTTGQTPGKMIAGLRVVDARGRPPGYFRAALRAIAGAAGTVLAGLGLIPMAMDPARRALHDRLLRTRVIHL